MWPRSDGTLAMSVDEEAGTGCGERSKTDRYDDGAGAEDLVARFHLANGGAAQPDERRISRWIPRAFQRLTRPRR